MNIWTNILVPIGSMLITVFATVYTVSKRVENENKEKHKPYLTLNNIEYLKQLDEYKYYYKLKGKKLGYKLHLYDTYANISSMPKKDIPYEEGVKIINKALSVLGEEYLKEFNRLLDNNVVDVYPKKGKKSRKSEMS